MARGDNTASVVRVLPKLRFYLPNIERRGQQRGLVITEDLAAILWLTETFTEQQGYAAQATLRDILGLEHGRFSQLLRTLIAARFVKTERGEPDGRNHRITLRSRGRSILEAIKEDHAAFIRYVLGSMSPQDQARCTRALERLAGATWEQMQARIKANQAK